MSEHTQVWPDAYYLEFDAAKRRALLDEALRAGGGDAGENEMRARIWDLRYAKKQKNGAPVDGYLALWVEMAYTWRNTSGRFADRRAVRELTARLHDLGLDAQPADGTGAALTAAELRHAVRFYLSTCETGSYGALFFGLGHMSRESLEQKIANEIAGVTCALPKRLGMTAEFTALRAAARQAFAEAFPDAGDLLDEACGGSV